MRVSLAVSAMLACAGPVLAADLPARRAPPVYVPPPPMLTWTGFYLGVNVGGTWNDGTGLAHTAFPGSDAALGVAPGVTEGLAALTTGVVPNRSQAGVIGGGQIGYNWTVSPSFVAGLEADIQGLASGGSAGILNTSATVVGVPITSTVVAASRIEYLGTVRGRIGFLATPTLLLYGTGGFAYGGVHSAVAISQSGTNGFIGSGIASNSSTRVGWTAGAGAEWRFQPNWSLKVEYLRYDLGTSGFGTAASGTAASAFFAGTPYQTGIARVRSEGNIVRAGVNYFWDTAAVPVVARY